MDETERARISFDEREKQGRTYWLWRPIVEWVNQWNEENQTPTFNLAAHLTALRDMTEVDEDTKSDMTEIIETAPTTDELVSDDWVNLLNDWYVVNIAHKLWRN